MLSDKPAALISFASSNIDDAGYAEEKAERLLKTAVTSAICGMAQAAVSGPALLAGSGSVLCAGISTAVVANSSCADLPGNIASKTRQWPEYGKPLSSPFSHRWSCARLGQPPCNDGSTFLAALSYSLQNVL